MARLLVCMALESTLKHKRRRTVAAPTRHPDYLPTQPPLHVPAMLPPPPTAPYPSGLGLLAGLSQLKERPASASLFASSGESRGGEFCGAGAEINTQFRNEVLLQLQRSEQRAEFFCVELLNAEKELQRLREAYVFLVHDRDALLRRTALAGGGSAVGSGARSLREQSTQTDHCPLPPPRTPCLTRLPPPPCLTSLVPSPPLPPPTSLESWGPSKYGGGKYIDLRGD